jgi:pimeloyl-ACP methyl ester carboxylesterase
MTVERLTRPDGHEIAFRRERGTTPGIVFLIGFNSAMTGTKATWLAERCHAEGRAFLRFDPFGHGESSGRLAEGTVGRWAADAIAMIDALTEGPQLLVGSSMGAWIASLAALAREGVWLRPSAYGPDPYPISRLMLEEAREHLLLPRRLRFDFPVRLLHGLADPDVPASLSLRLAHAIDGADVSVTLIPGGDHRLSSPADLDLLGRTIDQILAR